MINNKQHLLFHITLNFPHMHRYLKIIGSDSVQLLCFIWLSHSHNFLTHFDDSTDFLLSNISSHLNLTLSDGEDRCINIITISIIIIPYLYCCTKKILLETNIVAMRYLVGLVKHLLNENLLALNF